MLSGKYWDDDDPPPKGQLIDPFWFLANRMAEGAMRWARVWGWL